MDEWTSFLEHPLDKDLYKPRKHPSKKKPPLRVLVTDAGAKIAYNIIYSICSGNVFGPDQEIILHLINSRGSINHKAVILELVECGFPCLLDFVISSNPAVAFRKVDIVIVIATYEEMPGRIATGALIYQMIKARQIVKNTEDYANKNCKIIFTGPSTKAVTVLLGSFTKFATKVPHENISCVTYLDAVISKAMLAAKLRTTTDKIKNVLIWGATYPDVLHATVRMYPPGDCGHWEMKDISINEALQDDSWVYTTFALVLSRVTLTVSTTFGPINMLIGPIGRKIAVYRRVMNPDLLKFGKAVAQATVQHLKILHNGTDNYDETFTMAVISPLKRSYGVPPGFGFTFPVRIQNGAWEILEDIAVSVPTYLNIMRAIFNLTHGVMVNSIIKVVSFMIDYEAAERQGIRFCPNHVMDEVIEARPWTTRYFVTPSPAEVVERSRREGGQQTSRKSILWDDETAIGKAKLESLKSTIRFSKEASKESRRTSYVSYGTEEILSVFNKKSPKNKENAGSELYSREREHNEIHFNSEK